MCGIAGFAGIKNLTPAQARVATNKMKILGLYNQSRGVHGCGLYINGEIYKGVEDLVTKKNTKEFDDFLSNTDWIWPEMDMSKGNIMFLHTRQATAGAHVEANTHPFKIKSEDPNNNLIGVHNGTIENIWTLCGQHDVDHAKQHIYVDSKALYTLIDKVGLKILEEYKGYAALLWTKASTPNTIYIYHGAARKDHATEDSWEERPMYFLRTAEGIYFSSLISSLNAIRESKKQEVELLEYNTVFTVTNGKFTNEKVVINRADANLPVVTPWVNRPRVVELQSRTPLPVTTGFDGHRHMRAIAEEASRNEQLRKLRDERGGQVGKDLKTPEESIVWRETVPAPTLATIDKDAVRYYKGRHHRAGGKLCNNLLWIKDRGIIGEEGEAGVVAYWFWQGVLLRNQESYEKIVEESKVKNSWVNQLTSNWAYCISRFSFNPVTNMESEAVDADNFFRFSWYFDERRIIVAQIRPPFSGRCYTIANGFCIKIIPSNSDDKNVLTPKQTKLDLTTDQTPPHAPVTGSSYERNAAGILVPVNSNCGDACPAPVVVKSMFDVVFPNIEAFFKKASPNEIKAMETFVEDNMRQEWQTTPSNNEVLSELWTCVRTGIAANRTVREALNDRASVLEQYVKFVEEIVEVDSIDTTADPNLITKIKFYDKNGYWPEEAREPVVDAQSGFGSIANSLRSKLTHDMPWPDPDEETPVDGAIQTGTNAAFINYMNNMNVIDELDAKAKTEVGELVSCIHDISNVADKLNAIDESPYAQEASEVVYKNVNTLKDQLSDVADKHHHQDAIMRLHQIVHS